jgi:dTDP-4-amino-4,6-dideoxygalactose transaminase
MQGQLTKYEFPIADEINATTLSLPISYFHRIEDVEKVAVTINNFGG